MDIDQTIKLWFHYEEIAMHFNQLIIQYRLQLMGGAGVIGAMSSYLIGSKVESELMRHKLRAYVSSGLFILILAASYLDLYYYNELLSGAVKAILKLEAENPNMLYMSTFIKNEFPDGAKSHIYITYGLVLFPLLGFVLWSWYTHLKEIFKHG